MNDSHGFLTRKFKEELVWFVLFVSWIPFLYGQNIFLFWQNFSPILKVELPILLPEHAPIFSIPAFFQIPIAAFGLMTILGLAATIAAVLLRRKRFVFPILYILAANFVYVFNGSTFTDIDAFQALFYWLVFGLFAASVIAFLIHGHVLSTSFLMFASLIIFDALLFNYIEWLTSPDKVSADPFSLVSWLYGSYRPNLGLSLLIALSLVLIRAFFLAWQDNRSLRANVDTKILSKAALTTIRKLWWPVPLFFVTMSLVWYCIFSGYVEHHLICALDPSHKAGQPCNPSKEATLEKSLDAYTKLQIDTAKAEAKKLIGESKKAILETSGKAPNATARAVDLATRGRLPLTDTVRCSLLDVFCYVKNGVKSSANRAYQKARSATVAQIRNDLSALDQATTENAKSAEEVTLKSVDESAEKIALYTEASIRTSFTIFKAAAFLLTMYSVLMLIKTFLIVFARVLFDPDRGNSIPVQFMPGETKRTHGRIKVHGSEVTFPNSLSEDRFYTYSGMRISGPVKDRTFPLGVRFLIRRFFCQRFSFLSVPNKSCEPNFRQSVTLNLNAPAELVEWKLKEDEKVFFRFADLQGFSGDITFHRRASMSIGTLVFGRVILYYAEGPGTLLLRTAAAAESSASKEDLMSSEPETFVAWGMPLTYYVNAKLDLTNTFLSSAILNVQSPGSFVRDTDENRVRSSEGILRIMPHFLLPI